MKHKIIIVGYPQAHHVGSHFLYAARSLELEPKLCDMSKAYKTGLIKKKVNWWLRGHLPARLRQFSKEILKECMEFEPNWILCTGLTPIDEETLEQIGKLGIWRMNYLTDDPWNPAHRAPWFMKAMPFYDHIFTPRKANINDLMKHGCRRVSYLPFAYAPRKHFKELPAASKDNAGFGHDVIFAGAADKNRISYISSIIRAGFKLGLYGIYWERYPLTKQYASGEVDVETFRKAINGSRIALGLVRRANRDGNAMRTFEIPAIGTCMLTEDTREHRDIFGKDGENVLYFKNEDEMIKKIKFLLNNPIKREQLADNAHNLIVKGSHAYRDRLLTMLNEADI